MVEIRFYVPGTVTAGQVIDNDGKISYKDKSVMNSVEKFGDEDEEGEITAAAQKSVMGPDGEPLTSANIFCETIKDRTEQGKVSESIVDFSELLCLTPRGRYQVNMHPSFLRLRGKTHDYKVMYSSIKYLFLLPKPDELHWLFVIALDPPIRQGQTRYPHLVFQFEREEEVDLSLNLTE
jgi:structure-specific recognition protein 1